MEYTLRQEENATLLMLKGKLTYENNGVVTETLQAIESHPPRNLEIDLSLVEFIDSAGLGMLLLLKDRMPEITISLLGAKGQVSKILALTRLNELFTIR